MTLSEQLFERAQQTIPGGVNSPVRAFKSVGGTPVFVVVRLVPEPGLVAVGAPGGAGGRRLRRRRARRRAAGIGCSGMSSQLAPVASAENRASQPQLRPITSMTKARWWLAAVLETESIASTIR